MSYVDIDVLVDAAEDAGVEYREDYSGRGMFGAECFAIIGSTRDLVRFLRTLPEDVGEEFSDPTTDSMGLSRVFYWPYLAKTKKAFI